MLQLPSAMPNDSPDPTRLVTERLSDRLALLLGARIDSGALGPGDKLPTEQQLALAHGVSRTVVREAVHQLKSRGHFGCACINFSLRIQVTVKAPL